MRIARPGCPGLPASAGQPPTLWGRVGSPPPRAQSPSSFSFSTDDDNDVEVEALEGDSELNLVTEVWVEPQYGRVGPGPESWRHLRDLTYSEIPGAVSGLRSTPPLLTRPGGSPWGVAQPAGFPAPLRLCVLNVCDCGLLQSGRPGSSGPRGADPCPLLFVPQLHPRDVACIGSMLSFEYLIQLCQSKEWSPLPPEPRVSDGQWRRGPGEEQETGREEAAATGRDPGPQGAAVLLPRRQGWTRVETAVSTRPPSALTSWACCLSASSCRCSSSCSPEVGELRA